MRITQLKTMCVVIPRISRTRILLTGVGSSENGQTFSIQVDPGDSRSHIEVCPQGGVTVQYMANRINRDGGCALLADYGHDGEKEDTFRVRELLMFCQIYVHGNFLLIQYI